MKIYCESHNVKIFNVNDKRKLLTKIENKNAISKQYDLQSYSCGINIYSYKNVYIYPEVKGDSIWKEIERWITSAQVKFGYQSIKRQLDLLESSFGCDELKILNLLNKLDECNFSNKSFINFLRYIPVLKDYIFYDNFYISSLDNVIMLHLWNGEINLVLHFREDFIIDYYSYDNDRTLENESLVYTMKGTFSSSSNLKKSYKIERLLALFDRWDDESVIDGNEVKYQIYSKNFLSEKKKLGG
ncbi:hypothetical protein [Acinetobacter tandoii]|uniref:hypothetical protein n=1 Tax=Acinetobacter tandoii TaxID=202954 RepID=UPI00301B5B4C